MSRILGIDLGTTNSCMAIMEGGEPVTGRRFDLRRSLLRQFDRSHAALDSPVTDAYTAQQRRALALLTTHRVREALDLDREPFSQRER